jgi:hypothetical protein
MKRKIYHISLKGQKLTAEQLAAKEKQKRQEAEKKKRLANPIGPGILGKPHVYRPVFITLGVVALFLAAYYWWNMPPARGSVSGTVTFEGKRLEGGRITFIPLSRGKPPASAKIDSAGNYTLPLCPTGPVRITIETFPPPAEDATPAEPPKGAVPVKRPKPPPATGKYRKVPEEYSDPSKSPLQLTVTTGSQTHHVSFP